MLQINAGPGNLEERTIINDFIKNYIEENYDSLFPTPEKRTRRRLERPNYWASTWGKMLLNSEINNPNSNVSLKFRRRFRVPYKLFKEVIVPQCEENNIFEMKSNSTIPIEFRILIALRIMGRDSTGDDCEELSFVGEQTSRDIFKKFIKNYSTRFYDDYIKLPEKEMLNNVMETFRKLGFPGCFGSIDCTRVPWAQCPEDLRWLAVGKEGDPCISFETVVTHSRMCIHASIGFLGSYNDITISRNDIFVQKLIKGEMKDVAYLLYDEKGVPRLCRGAYLLSDNGYLKDGIFTCPIKTPHSREDLLWSEWCESVRKDVECFYRNIKSRWWFFKNGIRYHDADTIQDAFLTAVILHNMLMAYDGLIIELDNATEQYWDNLNPDCNSDEKDKEVEERNEDLMHACMSVKNVINIYDVEKNINKFMKGTNFTIKSFNDLRSSLVTHFIHQYGIGDLWWPKALVAKKNNFLGFSTIENRVNSEYQKYLYHRESNLRRLDSNGLTFTSKIGDGLFSAMDIKADTIIGYYCGEIINVQEREKREIESKGGFMIYISKTVILDCYDSFLKGNCILSYANSPKNCISTTDISKKIKANSVLSTYPKFNTVALKSIKSIKAHEEILVSYQSGYKFGPPEN